MLALKNNNNFQLLYFRYCIVCNCGVLWLCAAVVTNCESISCWLLKCCVILFPGFVIWLFMHSREVCVWLRNNLYPVYCTYCADLLVKFAYAYNYIWKRYWTSSCYNYNCLGIVGLCDYICPRDKGILNWRQTPYRVGHLKTDYIVGTGSATYLDYRPCWTFYTYTISHYPGPQ